MNNKKDIGELFKQNLEDKIVSLQNSELTWYNIEKELNNSTKRKAYTALYIRIFCFGVVFLSLLYYFFQPLTNLKPKKTNDINTTIQQVIDTNSFLKNKFIVFENIKAKEKHNNNLSTLKLNTKKETSSIKSLTILNNKTHKKVIHNNILSKVVLNNKKERFSKNNQLSKSRKNYKKENNKLIKQTNKNEKTETVKPNNNKPNNTRKKILQQKNKEKPNILIKKEQKWIITPFIKGSFSSDSGVLFNYGFLIDYKISSNTNVRFGLNTLDIQYLNNKESMVTLKYFELPVEYKYIVLKNKFETSIIAGGSYLYLNEANLISDNKMSQSTFHKGTPTLNLGINLNHHLGKSLHLNLESKINYLMNPESNSPHTIYSLMLGVGYKF